MHTSFIGFILDKKRMKIIRLLCCILCTALNGNTQWQYPATKTVDSSNTYFGVTYKDPYRWLENIKSTEVENWFKQQADFSNEILNKIPGRDALIKEWQELDKIKPSRYRSIITKKQRIFYIKTMPGETVGKVYYRQGLNGKEQLLFDPVNYIKDKTLSVQKIIPSYDGKKLLLSYAEGGGEISTIKVMDVDTKTFLPETIYPSWMGAISWTADNKAFTYSWLPTDDITSFEIQQNNKTKLHIIGKEVSTDIDFYSNKSYPGLGIQPVDIPLAELPEGSNYIIGYLYTDKPEYNCYYAPVPKSFTDEKLDWKILCKHEDGIIMSRASLDVNMQVIGDQVYGITYVGAKNYKVVSTSINNPDWKNAKIIFEEKKEVLENIAHSKDYLFAMYTNGINSRIFRYHLKTEKIDEINLPFAGMANLNCIDATTNDCLIGISSWNKPYTEFMYKADKNEFSETVFNKTTNFPDAYKNLVVEEVEVKGHDGAMIPLSIIYKKGLKLDGSNACIMEGYGSYGYSLTPFFDITLNTLATKNVVIAMAHVRGGGEKGDAWYKDGTKVNKPNTWKDFNSCTEYLIAKGYTSPAKMSGRGTSAGGILISRAITERPDLYASAVCNVGCANAMRMEISPNGPPGIPEFGTVTDSIECRALYEMDGVQHVAANTKYPAVMCVAGWNDPRVIAWEPGKFAAALQNASTSGKPVLMKVNYDNGHFTEDRSVAYANFADQFAFALWQCGHPDFQQRK